MDTKELITAEAFRLFLDSGYKNTSMSDLVKATGLSKGAFYHHFKSKESLYHEVIDVYFLSFYAQVNWVEFDSLSIAEIEILIKGFYAAFVPEIMSMTNKGMSRYFIMFFEAYDGYPTFKVVVRSFYKELRLRLIAAFKKEKVEHPEMKALNLIAKYEGMLFWFGIFPEEKIQEIISEL